MDFTYVYILTSTSWNEKYYVGLTEDLKSRLAVHNKGSVPATKPYRPWIIKTAIAFSEPEQARAFEKYLKSPSGRAFSKKRL